MKKSLVLLMCIFVLFVIPGTSFADRVFDAREAERFSQNGLQIDPAIRREGLRNFSDETIVVKFVGTDRPVRVSVRDHDVSTALAEYKARADVAYAEPNYLAYAFGVPNDPYYSPYQWHFDNPTYGGVHAESAWDITTGEGTVVAVIDTGVAYENYSASRRETYFQAPDLAGTTFVQGYDFVNGDTHANDDQGHGTHVAGTIAGTTNNEMGVAGLAHGAAIMPVKVLDESGSGTYLDVADGIRFAADNGVDVINLSLGGSSGATYLEEAVCYAKNLGVTVVAAAGNDGRGSISYPAAYDDCVIAVGATRFDEIKTEYSNYGTALDLMAPGGDTSVDQNGDGYVDGVLQQTLGGDVDVFNYYFYQGTSMAAPHVAAAAAMLKAAGVATTPSAIQARLEETADDLGVPGRDDSYGHGIINLAAALATTLEPTPLPEPEPEPSPEPEPVPEEPSGPITLFSEGFEDELDNWTQDSQGDWRDRSSNATEGDRAAEIDGRTTDGELISPAIVASGSTVNVTFDWLIESRLDFGEHLAFDVSVNGQDWQNVASLNGNQDPENVWFSESYDFNGVTSIRLRYRGTMSGSSEDAYVDNVVVTE